MESFHKFIDQLSYRDHHLYKWLRGYEALLTNPLLQPSPEIIEMYETTIITIISDDTENDQICKAKAVAYDDIIKTVFCNNMKALNLPIKSGDEDNIIKEMNRKLINDPEYLKKYNKINIEHDPDLNIINEMHSQNKIEQNKIEQNKIEQNKIEQNKIEQNKIEQNKIEQNKIEQNKTEQNTSHEIKTQRFLTREQVQEKIRDRDMKRKESMKKIDDALDAKLGKWNIDSDDE